MAWSLKVGDREWQKKSERELWQDLLVGHAYAALLLGAAAAVVATGRPGPGPGWGAWAFLGVLALIDCWLAVVYLAELRRRGCRVPPGVRSHPYLAGVVYSLGCLACAGGVFGLLLGIVARLG